MTTRASVIIPAHNEERVIGKLLRAIDQVTPGTDIVVAVNGSTDGTAGLATSFSSWLPVAVLDLPEPSKVAALNAAETAVDGLPRAFVDADVVATGRSVNDVVALLRTDPAVLIARPPVQYDTRGATPVVRAFYRARSRTPSLMTAMWGAGFYAVSDAGRARWTTFPTDVPDDLFVDALFAPGEKRVVPTDPVIVTPPRTVRALVRTLRRVYTRGPPQHAPAIAGGRRSSARTLLEVLRANGRSPRQVADATVYICLALTARLSKLGRRTGARWERDDTSR